ncbi:MAG: DUF2268 domain-containing putative Zn-dependent protease [Bacteroidota bacterium]
MNRIGTILIIAFSTLSLSFNSFGQSVFKKAEKVPDSVKVGDVTIYNLFKYQILAHQNNSYDSIMIIDKVYKRHKKIWTELYGVLFDKSMFSSESGMINWNRHIYKENKDSIESRVIRLIELDFSKKLELAIQGIEKLTERSPENIKLSIILSPFEGIGFGGIENDAFVLDLLDNNFDVVNMVEEGIPHELNHFIYDPTRMNDPNKDTPLRLTIDEGFACFYTYKYFDGSISKPQAVEQMNNKEWQWYLDHEKEVYQKCEPFFFYQGNDDPLRQLNQDLNAPKTLFYWLGFRIIEFYTQKYGENSWLDIYELPVNEVLEKSGYKQYIEKL